MQCVPSMKTDDFMDTGAEMQTLSMQTGCFMDNTTMC